MTFLNKLHRQQYMDGGDEGKSSVACLFFKTSI